MIFLPALTRAVGALPLPLLHWGAVVLIGLALFVATFGLAADTSGLPFRLVVRYISSMERRLRLMFIFMSGPPIVYGQLAGLFLVLFIWVLIQPPWPVMIGAVAAVLFGPSIWIWWSAKKRLEAVEEQLDNFILALANALKSTPSIGAAFNSVVTVIPNPLHQEVDLAIKEMKVGSSLDQALLHMAARIGSRQVDSALSAILIGRQVGGNLPKVLETTAISLREMRRLEGAIRTKTADGRFQLYVIGAMPFAFLLLLNGLSPGYFDPLSKSVAGWGLTALIFSCWITSIFLARKVLAVDI